MTTQQLLTIENEFLRAEITPFGAELCTLFDKVHGYDVLKKRENSAWDGISPILFPICGRLWEQTTYVDGTAYCMNTHGFAKKSLFSVSEHTASCVTLALTDTPELQDASYPFRFLLTIEYHLSGSTIITRLSVSNRDTRPLPFTFGFHPGFSLPLENRGSIEDAYIDFQNANEPQVWCLTPNGYRTGETEAFPLSDGHRIQLRSDLFERINSLFFINSGNSVTLASNNSDRRIRIDYEGFPYLGLWRPNAPNVDFICIEPWFGSPDISEKCTELSKKEDMILLPADKAYSLSYAITMQ